LRFGARGVVGGGAAWNEGISGEFRKIMAPFIQLVHREFKIFRFALFQSVLNKIWERKLKQIQFLGVAGG
jgi:hypothetical protein